jgi:alpha-ketoglutarate-dependent taurine dioxygenase
MHLAAALREQRVSEMAASLEYCSPTGLRVRKLEPAIGAELSGIDIAGDIPDAQAAEIRSALLAHGVIFFRNQKLTYESHLRFAGLFGQVMVETKDSPRPEVLEVRSKAGSREGTASAWHSDGCYMRIPPAISILRAIEVPPLGGDTCFSSAVAAYRDLTAEMKQCIASLHYASGGRFMFSRGSNRFFSREETDRRIAEYPDVTHPVVRVHPETGACAIYVNEAQCESIVGLENDVGRILLRYLSDLMKRPEYQVRWHWEPGAVAVWDNRAVQHYGVPDQIGNRHMERIMIAGTPTLSIADCAAAHGTIVESTVP